MQPTQMPSAQRLLDRLKYETARPESSLCLPKQQQLVSANEQMFAGVGNVEALIPALTNLQSDVPMNV